MGARSVWFTSLIVAGLGMAGCAPATEVEAVEVGARAPVAAPPIAEVALSPLEELGKALFFDHLASPDRQSCASCHSPSVGFTGGIPGINRHGSVYRGAVPQRFGNRKPPSAAYAPFSPVLHVDAEEGIFVGGNFWDGRATGERLGNPAAEQALGPFLNPAEQNNASKRAVLEQVARARYAPLWEQVWGEPLDLATPEAIDESYDRVGLAIAAYEASPEVSAFSSKYDAFLAGAVALSAEEAWGLELFEGRGKCAACHPSRPGPDGAPPLFTDFTFDNLGVPKNPENPAGAAFTDQGLGGFLAAHPDPAWRALAAENLGKHKVPTLRNVGKRPGKGFTKAYLHNGAFTSLADVVHFYNTRDVAPWAPPEVPENVNVDELGDLGLSAVEEAALVAFMEALSDGYVAK